MGVVGTNAHLFPGSRYVMCLFLGECGRVAAISFNFLSDLQSSRLDCEIMKFDLRVNYGARIHVPNVVIIACSRSQILVATPQIRNTVTWRNNVQVQSAVRSPQSAHRRMGKDC